MLCTPYIIEDQYMRRHNRDIAPVWAISRVVNPSQSTTATPLRHLGSLGENFLVNNCGMYDSL